MIGGDVETVRGDWAIRGEMAFTTGDTVVTGTSPLGVEGRSVRAGIGADRKAGAYRLNGTVLVEHRDADATALDLRRRRHQRQPRRGRRARLRPGYAQACACSARGTSPTASGFARTIGSWSLRDNLSLDGTRSAGSSAKATTPSRASPSAISSRCR